MKLPNHLQVYVHALLLTCFMTFVVSGIATWNAIGFSPGFMLKWLGSWVSTWAVAFPTLLVVGPFVRRLTAVLVAPAAR
ncbi:MAG: DUF2798 domain-containing protein [Hyphomicrobiaceae bacterium]